MNLAEEYFYRHGIKIPFAKHVNHGSMFFRSELADGKIRWKVLNIDSILDNSHPGKYSFKLLRWQWWQGHIWQEIFYISAALRCPGTNL